MNTYVLLALIGNLNSLTWEYETEFGVKDFTVTEDEATAFVGDDIKLCAESISALQQLLRKTGFNLNSSGKTSDERMQYGEEFTLKFFNKCTCDISEVSLNYYINGDIIGTKSFSNADSTVIRESVIDFSFTPEDFPSELSGTAISTFSYDMIVTDKNGDTANVCSGKKPGAKYGWVFYGCLNGEALSSITLNGE